MEDSTPALQIIKVKVPHVAREYPPHILNTSYMLYHSLLLSGSSFYDGEPGDFFIGSQFYVYYKSVTRRWVRAHFNIPVYHPLIDGLYLSHDELGPIWTDSDTLLPEPIIPVGIQFHCALAVLRRQQGRDDPIFVCD